jgi:hypothetical protein
MLHGVAIVSISLSIETLYNNGYDGQIFIIDNDCMSFDFQNSILGQLCNGWGEIFIVSEGQITQKFLGKTSFINFRNYLKSMSNNS